MVWREMRASWTRLAFSFVSVALGVAAVVVLRSVMQEVRATLAREARAFIGADLVLRSERAWTTNVLGEIADVFSAAGIRDRTDVVETQTMAAATEGAGTGGVRLVELRAVETAFPYYGAIELEGGVPYSHVLLRDRGVLVTRELLLELGLRVGDRLRLAGEAFTIQGVVRRDRVQRAAGIAFGPRVYMDLGALRGTRLLGFGSRATYSILARVGDGANLGDVVERLRRRLRGNVVAVRSWRSVEDRLGRNMTIAENYLSLVGFAIVVLGGIGVWSVTRVVVQQKIRSVAILRCVGASAREVLAIYVLQMLGLAAAGCALGVALAAIGTAAIPARLVSPLGVSGVGLTASAAGQGVVVGLLVSLLFALVPLLEVRHVKPLLLLRADRAPSARRRDWTSVLATAAIVAALALVGIWQAGSIRAGLYVAGGLGAVALALSAAGRLLVRTIAPLARTRHFALRHAVISLGRPGNQTSVILMAVGLGCFFVLGVRALQGNLLEELAVEVGPNSPDLVLIDVQRDQVDGVRDVVRPYVRATPRLLPLMRARVIGVEGRRVRLETPEAVRQHGRLTREYGLTYRDTLQDNERLLAGAFWAGPIEAAGTPDGLDTEVSIEAMVVDEADVGLGDVLRFDIGSRVIRARVTSIRKVTWDEWQNGGFVFVLRPAPALIATPHTFIGFLEVRPDAGARAALQRELVRQYPNVSAIDVGEVLASLREIVDNVTVGVTIVGAVVLLGGTLILVGALAMTKFQRLYEAAIYRTLGASTRRLGAMVAIEYGLLGFLAGALGAAGALGLSWVAATRLFEIDWRPLPGLLSAGVLATAAAAAVVGLAASADVLLRKPLATLGAE
jgi:putative ABC transport system permease protein